jgi:hypothetical protein
MKILDVLSHVTVRQPDSFSRATIRENVFIPTRGCV